MEIWDAYDVAGVKQKFDLIRDEKIPEGYYHLVSEVVIVNQNKYYLAMQRDLSKTFPGLYEVSVGGSVLKEETSEEAALRETKEETGIHITLAKLKYIYISEAQQTIYHCYLVHIDISFDSVVLQKGETMGYQWVDKKNIINFLNSGQHVPGRRERVSRVIEKV
jgi:8-oxo-dGTP diphosphatase